MMKKFTKLMLTLAFVVLGVGGATAQEVKIPIELTGSNPGITVKAINPSTLEELAENPEHIYAAKFTSSGQLQNAFQIKNMSVTDAVNQGCDRIIIEFGSPAMAGWNFHAYGDQGNYSEISAGATQQVLMLDGTKAIDDFTIFTLWASDPKEIIIKAAYFYKSAATTLEFDAVGKATTSKAFLVADGGLSYDASTGVLTTDGTAGTLTLEFENPTDLQYLKSLEVKRTGSDDIVDRLYFYDEDDSEINSWGYSKLTNSGLDANATNAFKNHKPVKKLVWKSAAGKSTDLSLTITSIEWVLKTMSALKGVDITTLPFKNWSADGDNDATITGDINWWECANNFNKFTGDVIYGGDGIDGSKRYVDLTSYKKLIIRGYGTIRLFYNWEKSTSTKPMEYVAIEGSTVQTKEVDLDVLKSTNSCTHFHLVGVKGSGSCYVESISALDGTETCDYNLSGTGYRLASVASALADASATSYDCTGLSSAESFEPANPNALFVANAGMVTNTKNVIVDGTCANLVLTDQKPFKAPAAFTAANATFTKTMTDAEYATMMIPFTAAVPEGLVARNIKGNDDDVLITEVVDGNVTKDKPVLLKGAAGDYVFTATDAEVAVADGIQDNGLLYGTYDATYNVPENSYVLQKQGDEVKFFKAVDGTTVKAFRAYLDLGHSEGSLEARNFTFDFENEATGLQQAAFAPQRQAVIYNLQGQRIAQPAQGLYIKGGKKVIIK